MIDLEHDAPGAETAEHRWSPRAFVLGWLGLAAILAVLAVWLVGYALSSTKSADVVRVPKPR